MESEKSSFCLQCSLMKTIIMRILQIAIEWKWFHPTKMDIQQRLALSECWPLQKLQILAVYEVNGPLSTHTHYLSHLCMLCLSAESTRLNTKRAASHGHSCTKQCHPRTRQDGIQCQWSWNRPIFAYLFVVFQVPKCITLANCLLTSNINKSAS